ncbi:MAG: hypothetical protein NZM43_01705 [Saprospiraceae bacterium]|nr:hypothetical protein [Saprospiraceae bacterium]MDW8483016.1 hypothetical protein [Saprospiraceae bacterium]
MLDLLQDPVLFALLWTIAVMAGLLIGWNLRAAWPERHLARQLERTTNERNALARLYTQVKYYYDLREVDLRKVSLEVGKLRDLVRQYESERAMLLESAQTYTGRMERAEAEVARLSDKVAELEAENQHLLKENERLRAEWEELHNQYINGTQLQTDLTFAQQRLQELEERNLVLEQERRQLREQLTIARARIEQQLRELDELTQQVRSLSGSTRVSDVISEPSSAPQKGDDLCRIRGITPELAARLREMGIESFLQVSQWDDDDVIRVARALNLSLVRIIQEDWVGQAQALIADA